ncbi:MAG: hypothetical protein AAF551_03705, partial [Bacteroidota bacterium]
LLLTSCGSDDGTPGTNPDTSGGPISQSPIEPQPSFGANGTHWPSKVSTPFLYDTEVSHIVTVGTDWQEVASAIQDLTPEMVEEGVLILVEPGTLSGNGVGGGSKAALEDLGDLTWTKRVTVAPKDGYGTVSIEGGAKFLKLYNIALAGFIFDSVKLQGCSHSALAWSKVTGWLAFYGLNGVVTQNGELVEVVRPDSKVQNGDASDVYSAGGVIRDLVIDGCYLAPNFFESPFTGAKPHTDTMQFAEVDGGGDPFDVCIKNTAMFSSNNTALQTGAITGLVLEHSYLVSGAASLARYPHLPGGATEATTNAINGSGADFSAKNSTIIGGIALNDNISDKIWSSVENTLVDREITSNLLIPAQGSFTFQEGLDESNSNMPPYPTDDFLVSIWGKAQHQ